MKEQVPSNEYSREYLLSTCDGYKDYNIYQGKKLPFRLQKAFALASPKSGMRILDYGCGRGELVRQCALINCETVGLDYSQPAVDLAKETTKDLPRENLKGLSFIQFNINNQARLPYRDNYFDIVFLMSVIRYIYDWEIYDILTEINRVLKLDGKLIIRATNGGTSISSKYFYNVNRILNPLIKLVTGKKLPVNEQPNSIAARLSVNIQTKESLKRHLEAANFSSKVWISYHTDVNYKRFSLVWFLGHLYYIIAYPGFVWPSSLIFGTDIWAVATKKWLNRNDREVGNQE